MALRTPETIYDLLYWELQTLQNIFFPWKHGQETSVIIRCETEDQTLYFIARTSKYLVPLPFACVIMLSTLSFERPLLEPESLHNNPTNSEALFVFKVCGTIKSEHYFHRCHSTSSYRHNSEPYVEMGDSQFAVASKKSWKFTNVQMHFKDIGKIC